MATYFETKANKFKTELDIPEEKFETLMNLISDLAIDIAELFAKEKENTPKCDVSKVKDTKDMFVGVDYNKENIIFDDNMLSKCSNLSEIHVNKDAPNYDFSEMWNKIKFNQ